MKTRVKQKAKEHRVKRNAHNLKNVEGSWLFGREERIAEVKRRMI